jgi:uncharacterized tellurite resistance protein B-like protein
VKHFGLAMFGSFKAFISNLVGDADQRGYSEQRDRLTAITALLIRVATVHHELSEARRAKLHVILRSSYGLDDSTAARLISDAEAIARTAIDLYRFTRPLNEVLDDEGRRRIVQMMWEIVYADRRVNEFEENIIWRAADLLGVSTRQRVELRQRIVAGMEALTPAKLSNYPIMASSAVTGD